MCWEFFFFKYFFGVFFLSVQYSVLLHLPPLRFHCADGCWDPKKIYRLKEDQAFWLSVELGRREKVAWHPSADFLPSPHMFMTDNDAPSVLGGGGQDFVDTMYYCSENKKGMRDH
jgi:hypothetical protein